MPSSRWALRRHWRGDLATICPPILADPIARDLGISSNWFFAAFSGSLVISGLLGPRVGRQIDRVGGRQVLCASNVVLAAGLALLGASNSVWTMSVAWLLLGVGMGLGLYAAAIGTLGRIGVRLIGGSMEAGREVTASSRFQQFGAILGGTVEAVDLK